MLQTPNHNNRRVVIQTSPILILKNESDGLNVGSMVVANLGEHETGNEDQG